MREIRYRKIADALRTEILAGRLAPGAVLPSEADLARTHDASRVTIRKALDLLREDELVDSRQGFGWFVSGAPVRQALTSVATIDDQLAAAGRTAERQVLAFGFEATPAHLASTLRCDTVLRVVRRNLADGRPFDLVTVWVPERLSSGLSRDDVESTSFYDLMDVRLGAASQTIGAAVATDEDAVALDVPAGSPLLVVERVSTDHDGEVVLVADHRFPAHLTEFVIELPFHERGFTPAGLRLVGE